MSALPSFDQGLSSLFRDAFSDTKLFSGLYHSITPLQWSVVECLASIHGWIEEAPDLLEIEAANASKVRGGGWMPKRDSTLQRIIDEAVDKDKSNDSLWRFLYIQKDDLKPVIVLGLVYIHWKDNFKSQRKPKSKDDEKSQGDEKSKSKRNPEEEASRWPTAAKQSLAEILMGVELPSRIANAIGWIKNKSQKRKKGS